MSKTIQYRRSRQGTGFAVIASILVLYQLGLPRAQAGDAVGGVVGQTLFPGPASEPVPGASVVLASDADASRFETVTDDEGRFRFSSVPPGSYRLEVTLLGVGAAEQIVQVDRKVQEVVLRLAFAGEVIKVEGVNGAERRRQSAEAVLVLETDRAQQQSADLGEVLARSQGVGVRRGGGLGSGSRISLGGLQGDQIRFFLDGVPLELAGYPFGLANVPVNLVEQVEVYRGVVPIRFGADALGGAINLTTDDVQDTRGSASYQSGAFGTHRITASARHLHAPGGLFIRAASFVDRADNDYRIDVEAPDERGRLEPARVDRFHDAYQATGAVVEAGLVAREWADRLLVRGFVSEYDKELPHNIVMTVPYGDVEYGAKSRGASMRYEAGLGEPVSLDVVGGYTYRRTRFEDLGSCVYSWHGQCVRKRRQPGEIGPHPRDQREYQHSSFARLNGAWRPVPTHTLRVSLAPTVVSRTGDERYQSAAEARDPLSAERDLFTLVSGAEYELDAESDTLDLVAFLKHYLQLARTEEALPGGVFRTADRDSHRVGAGSALRYQLRPWLEAKASYEWATRLPRADEIFGDGALIVANLELAPEHSHNYNLGVTASAHQPAVGDVRLDLNAFIRDADQLIVLLGNDRQFGYDNVFGARSIGGEAAGHWTSPDKLVAVDGNVTYQDFRNTSSEGSFGAFAGDRIPNRPYLFANASARVELEGPGRDSRLALLWNSRYVHSFFRSWESVGARNFKQVIDAQLLHGIGLTYLVRRGPLDLSFTAEVQNLTDAPAFDFFGVQRPGRALYLKTAAEF